MKRTGSTAIEVTLGASIFEQLIGDLFLLQQINQRRKHQECE
jgi:hypothetical protein